MWSTQTYHGFHTDCLLKSKDWRFLYQNFIKIGQVVEILHATSIFWWENGGMAFSPLPRFAIFCARDTRLVLSKRWFDKFMKLHLIFFNTRPLTFSQAQTVKKREKFEDALFHDFYWKFCHWEETSFYFKDL